MRTLVLLIILVLFKNATINYNASHMHKLKTMCFLYRCVELLELQFKVHSLNNLLEKVFVSKFNNEVIGLRRTVFSSCYRFIANVFLLLHCNLQQTMGIFALCEFHYRTN